jgi:hypothetical protein
MTSRIELSVTRRFPFAEAYEFGAVGAYERLVGRVNFALDPDAPAQRGITDLGKAPADPEGFVHFVGDFSILKPVDPARGNRRLFFDYGNRGNKRIRILQRTPASNEPRLAHPETAFDACGYDCGSLAGDPGETAGCSAPRVTREHAGSPVVRIRPSRTAPASTTFR